MVEYMSLLRGVKLYCFSPLNPLEGTLLAQVSDLCLNPSRCYLEINVNQSEAKD